MSPQWQGESYGAWARTMTTWTAGQAHSKAGVTAQNWWWGMCHGNAMAAKGGVGTRQRAMVMVMVGCSSRSSSGSKSVKDALNLRVVIVVLDILILGWLSNTLNNFGVLDFNGDERLNLYWKRCRGQVRYSGWWVWKWLTQYPNQPTMVGFYCFFTWTNSNTRPNPNIYYWVSSG